MSRCWKYLSKYDGLLQKIAMKWWSSDKRIQNFFSFRDLYHDLVLVFHRVWKKFGKRKPAEFRKILSRSCENHFVDEIWRKHINRYAELDYAPPIYSKEEPYTKWNRLKEVVVLPLSRQVIELLETEDLESVAKERRGTIIRQRSVNKSDIRFILRRRLHWSNRLIDKVFQDIQDAYKKVYLG